MSKVVSIEIGKRRPPIMQVAEAATDSIALVDKRSIYAQWSIGHYPREIGRHFGLGDNAVCDIVRELAADDLGRALQAAERRGRLTQWPVVAMRRAA